MTALLQGPEQPDAVAARRQAALVLGGTLLLFWPTLIGFPATWSQSYHEHGFVVAGLTAWLLWRDGPGIVRARGPGLPDLTPLLLLLSGAWMLAAIMNLRVVQQGLVTLIAMVWGLTVFGRRAAQPILAIGLTFLFAVPFWSVFVPALQRATVIASGGVTQLAGISAVIGYDYIQISTGTFLVEEGCAGLNYLMGGLVLGAVYAHLFVERWQTQLKIVSLAGAMAIAGNWIRVTVLIFLGEATAMQSPYIGDHLWQGWAIFMALTVPTYFLARRIERRDRARFATHVDVAAAAAPTGEGAAEKGLEGRRLRRAVLAGSVAGLGPVVFMLVGVIPRGGDLDREASVLGAVEGWTVAADETPDGWRPQFSGADAETAWTLSDGSQVVGATRQYFMGQSQGDELIQFSNRVAPDSLLVSDRVIGPVGPSGRLLHEALFQTEDGPRVAWYWYRVAGFDTAFEAKAKLLEVLAFFARSPASELVTLTAACDPRDCRGAADALRSVLGAPALPAEEASVAGEVSDSSGGN